MTKRDYIILAIISNYGAIKYREIASKSGFSLGLINSAIKKLISNDWITEDFSLTEKAEEHLKENKPENAIILAAGVGLRMIPAQKTPKGLLAINNEILIERLINQLTEKGITDISIVVGYEAEKYEYLIELYGVELIYNPHFAKYDNMYSLNRAKEKLSNTYIVPCDIWFAKNPFNEKEFFPWYAVSDFTHGDSFIRVNRKMELVKTDEGGNYRIGLSYLNKKASGRLIAAIEQLTRKATRKNKYIWEDVLFSAEKEIIPLARIMHGQSAYCIKTYENLRDLDNECEHLVSKRMNLICDVFSVDAAEITDISGLMKSMTNTLMRFSVNNVPYLLRIPGEGSNELADRYNETRVYESLKNSNICDEVVYINPDTGYKISKYIENSRVCDINNLDDLTKALNLLKKLHNQETDIEHYFNIFEQIEYYEKLRDRPSSFANYDLCHKRIFELKDKLDEFPKEIALCHIDPIGDNILLFDDEIVLIDWEYAGKGDKYLDLAFLCVYYDFSVEQVDQVISIYNDGEVTNLMRFKVYAYIAASGLLWTVWSEYKEKYGVKFYEYMVQQYRCAKKYLKLAFKLYQEMETENEI